MIPGKTVTQISYLSPEIPTSAGSNHQQKHFSERTIDIIFFGYQNFANEAGLDWFIEDVFPLIGESFKLHIAGKVNSRHCKCAEAQNPPCDSTHDRIICHGVLVNPNDLDDLIKSARVSINPVRENSGIATKTCRAMALGTPVVVLDTDGTFANKPETKGGVVCDKDEGESCLAININRLLQDEEMWKEASTAAPKFILDFYGEVSYNRDWDVILKTLDDTGVRVVVRGDALQHGESLASQTWHIIDMLSRLEGVEVSLIGDRIDPMIPGVSRGTRTNDALSPFPTGYQANLLIQQNWPPTMTAEKMSYCGAGCRVVKILPWEFGSLPVHWMDSLRDNVDFLWGVSRYNQQIFARSGIPMERTHVAYAGIACNEIAQHIRTEKVVRNNGIVRYLYTGGFLPRKGWDILVKSWETVFCGREDVELVMHTNYELGYSSEEINEIEATINLCGNILWSRNEWKNRSTHLDMFLGAHVYVSPYRSEGFGLSIVEAMYMGLTVIVTGGKTASSDYLFGISNVDSVFSVNASETVCTHHPCNGTKLCVFDGECKELVYQPSWYEPNRAELERALLEAFARVKRLGSNVQHSGEMSDFCWNRLSTPYKALIGKTLRRQSYRQMNAVKRPKQGAELEDRILLSGVIESGRDITLNVLTFLTHLQCSHDVYVQVIVGTGATELVDMQKRAKEELYPANAYICKEFDVFTNSGLGKDVQRIKKIVAVRELQRLKVADFLHEKSLNEQIVILADLDVVRLPPVSRVIESVRFVTENKVADVLCANGMDRNNGYYDWYATILEPDTFIYPIEHRPNTWDGEDKQFIMGEHGEMTSEKLWNWFREMGGYDENEGTAWPVPVRSCFGGMAVYRADKFLDFGCNYGNVTEDDLRYANNIDGVPCEHVVFHNCLRRKDGTLKIAVHPTLNPIWHKDVEHICYARENIWRLRRGEQSVENC
mmetsp:Transcript_12883/g.19566  ORF Transcript_12883/g.19566 Transcript_12883/m.19566 type:complete len:944 (-) Transcript_12883:132-2963(-)